MDPSKIPFNALIVGPTNSGKTKYLVHQFRGPFMGKFDYIVLICPTFVHNKTYDGFVDNDPRIFVIICSQHEVEGFLKPATSKDVKGRTSKLVSLGFSARHSGISMWVLAQQITSISIRENVAAIVLVYHPRVRPSRPSSKTTLASFRLKSIKSMNMNI